MSWVRWIVGRERGTPATHRACRHALPFVAFAPVGVAVVCVAPDIGADRTRWQFVAAVGTDGMLWHAVALEVPSLAEARLDRRRVGAAARRAGHS